MPCLWTRQSVTAFNQSLSFDTSRVTTMAYMFQVRSALPMPPSHRLVSPCSAATFTPSPPARLPPSQHTSLWTRQSAQAYNQPLSFNTSRVTSMDYMFGVRSAPAHATHSPVGPMLRVT